MDVLRHPERLGGSQSHTASHVALPATAAVNVGCGILVFALCQMSNLHAAFDAAGVKLHHDFPKLAALACYSPFVGLWINWIPTQSTWACAWEAHVRFHAITDEEPSLTHGAHDWDRISVGISDVGFTFKETCRQRHVVMSLY